jgi:SEC-C motif-containing protein
MTAEDLMSKRFAALASGDYASVYETYHQDSPFIRQFSDCDAYICFARQQLNTIKVWSWQSLRQRQIDSLQQEHLLIMELAVDGRRQYFYELALLINTPAGWRYHSAQKLSAEDYAGPPEQIQFSCFDQVTQKIRY